MYDDSSSPVRPEFDWRACFTWRNPLAVFGGAGFLAMSVLLSIAVLAHTCGCHLPRPMAAQPATLPAVTLDRRVVYLETGATTTCRVYLDAHLFAPLDVQLGAVVQSQSNDRSELRVEITPERVAGESSRIPCELRLHAHHGVGDFSVRIHAGDACHRRAEGILQVHVQRTEPPVQAETGWMPW
jgi:hypothetical protein